jgi:hypothetical protein
LTNQEKLAALQALQQTLAKVASGDLPDFRMIIRGTQRSTHSDSPEYSGRAAEIEAKGFCILPYHKNGTKPGDVWHIIPEDQWRKDQHYAVFPLELCELLLLATCPTKALYSILSSAQGQLSSQRFNRISAELALIPACPTLLRQNAASKLCS